ncbi:TPA: DUF3293 domain-containing protein [Aeromonas veronii]
MILWENYKKICFIAPFEPPDWSAFAIITAWNPASQWVGERRNRRRERALWRHLTGDLLVPVLTDKSAVCLGNIESFWIARNLV